MCDINKQGIVVTNILIIPIMQDTRRRVKLYELNAERQWDDKGTGENRKKAES